MTNWAEIVQSLYERGGNDTLEFNVQVYLNVRSDKRIPRHHLNT